MSILFVGDSITKGEYSYDWVTKLKSRLCQPIENIAINGATSSVIKYRSMIQIFNKKPSMVCIMIGGNDVIAISHTKTASMYKKLFPYEQLEDPTIELYKEHMITIIHELDNLLAPETQILILSPPPVGEGGMNSDEWIVGNIFSELCEDIVKSIGSSRVQYKNLFEIIKYDMETHHACDRKLNLSLFKMRRNFWLSKIFSFDKIRAMCGYRYTHDGIHFCSEFGIIIENIVFEWISKHIETF